MLTAEIVAIGSELLTPDKTDTNSLWLTEKLNEIGIEVMLKTIVGDSRERLEETLRDALRRSNLVITTGGLGPTEDDITRECAAKACGRELVFREDALDEIRARFKQMRREMPERNRRQAYFIEGAEMLLNPNGSAPGMLAQSGTSYLAVLPGPPREMKPMFENFVLPKLREQAGEIVVRRRVIRVAGMGESAVDELIAPIYTQFENPSTTILFNRTEIEIHLTAKARTEAEAVALNEKVAAPIIEKLGANVFAENGETMEEIIAELLTKNNRTLSIAESCTGGLVAQRLTELSGASKFFTQAVVAYANQAKIELLNVAPELLDEHGAVSAEVAEAMAKGIRETSRTDYGISITGVAGPNGGTEEKPVGLVYIGFSDADETISRRIFLPGDRSLIRWRASQAVLELLRRKLKDAHKSSLQ